MQFTVYPRIKVWWLIYTMSYIWFFTFKMRKCKKRNGMTKSNFIVSKCFRIFESKIQQVECEKMKFVVSSHFHTFTLLYFRIAPFSCSADNFKHAQTEHSCMPYATTHELE